MVLSRVEQPLDGLAMLKVGIEATYDPGGPRTTSISPESKTPSMPLRIWTLRFLPEILSLIDPAHDRGMLDTVFW
jgi:hypothetical protein